MSELESQVVDTPAVETDAAPATEVKVESPAVEVKSEPAPPAGSVREAINKARDTLAAKKASAPVIDTKAQVAKPDAKSAAPQVSQTAKPADGRPRETDGRFKKIPRSWRQELAPKYEALDQDVQQEIYKREEDVFQGIEQYKGKAQLAHEFEQTIQPYMARIQSLGVTPIQAVQKLMNADHVLTYGDAAQKQAMFQAIARDYGIQLDPNYQPAQADPVSSQLQQEVATLKQTITTLQQNQEQASLNPYVNEVQQFRAAHEHFGRLENVILGLIQSGAAKGLKDAYDMALFADPELRNAAIAEQQADKQKQEAQRVATAKAAAVQVRGSPAAPLPQTINPKNRREVIQSLVAGLRS